MFYRFRLHKENEKTAGVLAILEELGAVVLSIVGASSAYQGAGLPQSAFSQRFMIGFIKKLIEDTYQQTSFVAGTAGVMVFDYSYREFEVEAMLDDLTVKQLTSRYQITWSCNIVEDSLFSNCSDFVECESLRLSCSGRELFSSKKLESLKNVSVRLFMPSIDNLECYVVCRFAVVMDSETVFGSLLMVFRLQGLQLRQIRNKHLVWVMQPDRFIRYFYRQNREECYLHPCLGEYKEVEDIFYRGDHKHQKNVRVELSFTPDHCEKQEFIRIAEGISERIEFDYNIVQAEANYEIVKESMQQSLFSLDTDRQWHQYSCNVSGFRTAKDELSVKLGVLTTHGICPNYQTFWLYDDPQSKSFVEKVTLVQIQKNFEPVISYEWRYPFMGVRGQMRVGLNNLTFVGGSRINQLRKQFYLTTAEATKKLVTPRLVDVMAVRELFSLNRKQPVHMKTVDPPNYNYANGQLIGWISSALLRQYSEHPIERMLIKVGSKIGYVLPIGERNEDLNLYVCSDGKLLGTVTVIEIVPEQQVLLTGQLFEILEKSSITFQDIRRVQETLYQRNCRLLKKYLTTGKMDENVTNEQLFMAPILRKVRQYRPTKQLMEHYCSQFERESMHYPIGVRLNVLFTETLKDPEEIIANTRLSRAVLIVRTVHGVHLLAVRCGKGDSSKHLTKIQCNYLIVSECLRKNIGDQLVTLITCPYLTKMLYSKDTALFSVNELEGLALRPTHKGIDTYVRKYLEEFSYGHPTAFNHDKWSWSRYLQQLPNEVQLPKKTSGKVAELLLWLGKAMQVQLELAQCSYYELMDNPINMEYLYRLKRQLLNQRITSEVRKELEELLRDGELFRYRQFVGYTLGIQDFTDNH